MENGIAMEPMKGKWASSRVDLGYTDLFCIPEVHQCSSCFVTVFLGLSGVPSRKSRLITWDRSACNEGESSLISQGGGCLIRFLELRQEPGVYSRITAGIAIRNSTLFSEVRNPA